MEIPDELIQDLKETLRQIDAIKRNQRFSCCGCCSTCFYYWQCNDRYRQYYSPWNYPYDIPKLIYSVSDITSSFDKKTNIKRF
jgi:hypothetical protein